LAGDQIVKIAVISKADVRGGGASVVAAQLTDVYRSLGHEADHFHSLRSDAYHPYGTLRGAVRILKGVEGRLGFRDHSATEKWLGALRSIARNYDAVHLHDMSTLISHRALGWLANQVPTIWTIHDCSPFTAGCLYPGACDKFTDQCGPCPQLGNWPLNTRFDRTSTLHARRKNILASKIRFCAPSKWMVGEYLRAGWPKDRINHVSNGVDRSQFKPQDRKALKKKYGLEDHDGLLLLFSAGWLHDSRKGPREAASLAHSLRHLNPKLVLVGRYSDEAAAIFQNANIAHYGFVSSEQKRAELYGMCDGTLTFSHQENAPLIAIESLAVGTPVFGYAAGGLPEIVKNGHTGFLAPVGHIQETIRGAEEMLSGANAGLRRNCAAAAKKNHDYAKVAQSYLGVFEKMRETVA
jgi:glycosyltransferase involved in cell wall biosynthesis